MTPAALPVEYSNSANQKWFLCLDVHLGQEIFVRMP